MEESVFIALNVLQLNKHVIFAYLMNHKMLPPDWLRHIPLTDTSQSGEAALHISFRKGKKLDFKSSVLI